MTDQLHRYLTALAPTRSMAHGASSFMHHLFGVYQILVAWGCAPAVYTAGLFHSTYGTEFYAASLFDVADRQTLRELIGPEAEALVGMPIGSVPEMRLAAEAMLALGVPAVLLKGGHLPGDTLVDLLATPEGTEEFAAPRIQTRHTHGTGCTTASAVAAGLAQGLPLRAAVLRARGYVRAAIAAAPGFGRGHGPLNHAVTFDPDRVKEH